jgi:hypothetical protein
MQVVPVELARWDALALPGRQPAAPPSALVLPVFSDERPLRGAAGLADWRLSGRLSRLIRSGRFTATSGESLLMPPAGNRLPFARIVLFGLGPAAAFADAGFRVAAAELRRILHKAGLTSYAIQLPGRGSERVAARRAVELWQDVARQDGHGGTVTLIESPQAQKEVADLLRR